MFSPLSRFMVSAAMFLVLLSATTSAKDKVLLHDGRVIEGTIVETADEGITQLEISGIAIPISNDLIADPVAELPDTPGIEPVDT